MSNTKSLFGFHKLTYVISLMIPVLVNDTQFPWFLRISDSEPSITLCVRLLKITHRLHDLPGHTGLRKALYLWLWFIKVKWYRLRSAKGKNVLGSSPGETRSKLASVLSRWSSTGPLDSSNNVWQHYAVLLTMKAHPSHRVQGFYWGSVM